MRHNLLIRGKYITRLTTNKGEGLTSGRASNLKIFVTCNHGS